MENPCVCRCYFQESNTPHWSFLRNPISSVTTASLTRGYKRVELTISEPLVAIFLIAVFRDEGVLVSTSPPPPQETVVLILLRVIGITSSDNSDKRFGYGDDCLPRVVFSNLMLLDREVLLLSIYLGNRTRVLNCWGNLPHRDDFPLIVVYTILKLVNRGVLTSDFRYMYLPWDEYNSAKLLRKVATYYCNIRVFGSLGFGG